MDNRELILQVYEKNNGIFKLIPVFVPRQFSTPGRRLRLPTTTARGVKRGAIKERWFSSVINQQPRWQQRTRDTVMYPTGRARKRSSCSRMR